MFTQVYLTVYKEADHQANMIHVQILVAFLGISRKTWTPRFRPGNAPFSLVSPVTWDFLGHGKIQMLGTHPNITVGYTSWILQYIYIYFFPCGWQTIIILESSFFGTTPIDFPLKQHRNRYSRGELCLPLGWVRLRYCVVMCCATAWFPPDAFSNTTKHWDMLAEHHPIATHEQIQYTYIHSHIDFEYTYIASIYIHHISSYHCISFYAVKVRIKNQPTTENKY